MTAETPQLGIIDVDPQIKTDIFRDLLATFGPILFGYGNTRHPLDSLTIQQLPQKQTPYPVYLVRPSYLNIEEILYSQPSEEIFHHVVINVGNDTGPRSVSVEFGSNPDVSASSYCVFPDNARIDYYQNQGARGSMTIGPIAARNDRGLITDTHPSNNVHPQCLVVFLGLNGTLEHPDAMSYGFNGLMLTSI